MDGSFFLSDFIADMRIMATTQESTRKNRDTSKITPTTAVIVAAATSINAEVILIPVGRKYRPSFVLSATNSNQRLSHVAYDRKG